MLTRSLVRQTIALTALACLAATNAHAQNTFYPTNATISAAVNGNAIVGYANQSDLNNQTNGTSPTVSLVTGGSISGYLQAFNSSTVNVTGGSVGSYVFAENNSMVNVSGGSVGSDLEADNSSIVTITGGTFGKNQGVNFIDGTRGGFTLVGNNLMATNARPDTNFFGGTDYDLSGTLQGGTNLSGYVLNVQGGRTFTLQDVAPVPEPGSVALLVGIFVTGAGFVRKRRSLR